ncbi:ABC transporter substrate-binding protein [Litorihabitans aurantiacus]|uniref:Peptide ABC transporter substrate-binding protein n=1 Tax=Litorihabitans aurantiacus TaxID=1930061 RepID=A0AA37XG90_9MICO|nr:ABC transporter substrate-binding protein [Litorihabitans aurantiacus]GMA32553.1 peptide ABC transporter substrate-binding protein [Litorihabitans aurantiacus]
MNVRVRTAAAAVAAGALLAGCSGGDAPPASSVGGGAGTDQVLSIGMLYDVPDWDPAMAHVGHNLQPYQVAYDSLLLREPDGELSPMLATEWNYDDSRTVLTLELRDDVTFSDGAAFDADAVVANFEHFKGANGRQAAQLTNYAGAVAVDADTVEVTLTRPDPAFTYFLSQAAGLMGSPDTLEGDDIGSVPVGSGPYVMDTAQSVAGSQYVFTAREDYWNPDLQKFGGVTLRLLADVTARANALISGQVNATLVEPASIAQLEGAGLTLVESQVDWMGLMLLDRDGTMEPGLADVRVRQAVNHALDREALLATLQLGHGVVTSQPFGEDSGAFDPELDDYYPYDPERARELLTEAGYADGVTLTLPSMPLYETTFAVLSQQLGEVGITLEPVAVPSQDYVTEITSGKYTSAFYGLFQAEAWVAINQFVSTDSLYNVFDTTTPELDTLLDEVANAADEEASDAAAVEVNRYVVENAWTAPLYRRSQIYFTDTSVTVLPQVQSAVPSIYNFSPAA